MLSAVFHNIRSLHNVGSMFRTSDAAGVDKIYLCGYTPKPVDLMGRVRPEIAKVALGAEQMIPWEHHKQTLRLVQQLQKEGKQVIALEQTKKSIPYTKFRPKFPCALIVGNEVEGIPKRITDAVDAVIQIPMLGKKESLNVSVAFGIAVYQFFQNDVSSRPRSRDPG